MNRRGMSHLATVGVAAIGTAIGLSTAFGATSGIDELQQASNCCYTQQCQGGGSVTHCTHTDCSSNQVCSGQGSQTDCWARAKCITLKNIIAIDAAQELS